jgi:hypothetical protein
MLLNGPSEIRGVFKKKTRDILACDVDTVPVAPKHQQPMLVEGWQVIFACLPKHLTTFEFEG